VSDFERLRAQVDLVGLAGRYTDLRPSGEIHVGRCLYPDHEDQNPSFYVYPEGRYFCYGCGHHGDVVDLWAVVKGLRPGIEAASDLAREYRIDLPELDVDAQKEARRRRSLEAQYAVQAEEAHANLSRYPVVLEWWVNRGFDEELRERFLLGSNSDGTEAIIPFWRRGSVQCLIRRKLEGEPKYVLPKTEEFPYGHRPLFIPRSARERVVLVEGYVDALALAALGMDAAAIGGTGISTHQRDELWELPGPIYIMPDHDDDKQGEKAARRWVEDLYPKALLCPPNYQKE
jgi:DNA primase